MAAGMLAEEGCLSPPVSCDGFLPVLGIDLAYAGFSGWLKAKTFFVEENAMVKPQNVSGDGTVSGLCSFFFLNVRSQVRFSTTERSERFL